MPRTPSKSAPPAAEERRSRNIAIGALALVVVVLVGAVVSAWLSGPASPDGDQITGRLDHGWRDVEPSEATPSEEPDSTAPEAVESESVDDATNGETSAEASAISAEPDTTTTADEAAEPIRVLLTITLETPDGETLPTPPALVRAYTMAPDDRRRVLDSIDNEEYVRPSRVRETLATHTIEGPGPHELTLPAGTHAIAWEPSVTAQIVQGTALILPDDPVAIRNDPALDHASAGSNLYVVVGEVTKTFPLLTRHIMTPLESAAESEAGEPPVWTIDLVVEASRYGSLRLIMPPSDGVDEQVANRDSSDSDSRVSENHLPPIREWGVMLDMEGSRIHRAALSEGQRRREWRFLSAGRESATFTTTETGALVEFVPPGDYTMRVVMPDGSVDGPTQVEVLAGEEAIHTLAPREALWLEVQVVAPRDPGTAISDRTSGDSPMAQSDYEPVADTNVVLKRQGFYLGSEALRFGCFVNEQGSGHSLRSGRTVTSDRDGIATFTMLESARYELLAHHPQLGHASGSIGLGETGRHTTELRLSEIRPIVEITLHTPDGRPPDATIFAFSTDTLYADDEEAQRFGEQLRVSEPDSNEITMTLPNEGSWRFASNSGSDFVLHTERDIRGVGPHQIDLHLAQRLNVELICTANGAPIAEANFHLFQQGASDSSLRTNGALDDQGTAELELFPAPYGIRLFIRDESIERGGHWYEADFEVTELTERVELDLSMAELALTFVEETTGAPIESASVAWQAIDVPGVHPRNYLARSGAETRAKDGAFEKSLQPGLWKIRVRADDHDPWEAEVDLVAGSTTRLEARLPEAGETGSISGRVMEDDGLGLDSVRLLYSMSSDGQINPSATIDMTTGEYIVRALDPGFYSFVWGKNYDYRTGRSYLVHETEAIEVVAGEVTNYDVRLRASSALEVRVLDEDGAPLYGSELTLVHAGMGRAWEPSPFLDYVEMSTDAFGRAFLYGMPPGDYEVIAVKQGYGLTGGVVPVHLAPHGLAHHTIVMRDMRGAE